MNAFVCDQGGLVNVDTPVNEAMVNVVKAIDAGELESGFENVELVLSSAGH